MTRCDCTPAAWCEDCYNREAQPARDELARIMAARNQPVADEPAVCSVCGTWTQCLDPGHITPTCTDCADRPYGGEA